MAENQYDRQFRLEDIEAALARAAEAAKRDADEAGLPFIASENGQRVEEQPREARTPVKAVREGG